MKCIWKCNLPWHVKFQGNRRDWVLCPYPKNAWNMFRNVIDNGTSNFRTIGGVGVCVPHWCPSETYHENAWNAFENVIWNLPRKCMECVWKCNWPWHVKFQGNRRDWVSCPSETYPKNAWNVFKNVIDNGTSNFRTIGGVGVCVHVKFKGLVLCPYPKNAWNMFRNQKPTTKMHGMRLKM